MPSTREAVDTGGRSQSPDVDHRLVFESSADRHLLLTPTLDIVAVGDAYLRATDTRLQATMDSLLDPSVLLQAVSDEGRIVDFVYADANQAACESIGVSRERLVGCPTPGNPAQPGRPEDARPLRPRRRDR